MTTADVRLIALLFAIDAAAFVAMAVVAKRFKL